MTKYEMLQDDDLIKLSRLGDKDAEEFLLVKYTPMVISETRTLFLIGAELEDLTQEGMIGLFMAIRDYSLESDASFKTFAYSCIRNRLKAAITRANRMKHSPLNTYILAVLTVGRSPRVTQTSSLMALTRRARTSRSWLYTVSRLYFR